MRRVGVALALLVAAGGGTALAGLNPSAGGNPLQCEWHSSYSDYVQAKRALASGHGIATPAAAVQRMEAEGFSQVTGLYQDGVGVWHAWGVKQGVRQAIALNPNGNMAVGYRNIYPDCRS